MDGRLPAARGRRRHRRGQGETSYRKADGASKDVDYRNIFVCEFAPDGRCRSFVEWYMKVPQAAEQEDEPAA